MKDELRKLEADITMFLPLVLTIRYNIEEAKLKRVINSKRKRLVKWEPEAYEIFKN